MVEVIKHAPPANADLELSKASMRSLKDLVDADEADFGPCDPDATGENPYLEEPQSAVSLMADAEEAWEEYEQGKCTPLSAEVLSDLLSKEPYEYTKEDCRIRFP